MYSVPYVLMTVVITCGAAVVVGETVVVGGAVVNGVAVEIPGVVVPCVSTLLVSCGTEVVDEDS